MYNTQRIDKGVIDQLMFNVCCCVALLCGVVLCCVVVLLCRVVLRPIVSTYVVETIVKSVHE